MSLLVWMPFNGNVNNLGTSGAVFNSINIASANGKVTKNCYSFNGSNAYVYGNISLTAEMTFSCWVKFSGTSGYHIIDCRAQSGETGYQPMYGGTSYGLQCYSSNGGSYTWPAATCGFTTGVWYHLCTTITATTATLYINGESKGTQSGTFGYAFGSRQMRIGTRCSGANWFNGQINDVRVYNHALSTKEIKDLAKGLCLHYKFNFEDLYQPIDYIEFTGSQYIDSGVKKLTASNFSIEIDYQRTNIDDADACLFGQRQFGKFTNIYNKYYESAYGNTTSGTANNYDRNTLLMNEVGLYKNGTLLISKTLSSISSSYSALIGAFSEDSGSNAKWFYKGKLYSLRIVDDGTPIRNFIPCICNITGKAGLYDTINNVFYVNNGTSSDFKVPFNAGFTPVDYIEGTGTQYINLPEVEWTSWMIDCQYTSTSSEMCIIGNIDNASSNRWELFCDSSRPYFNLWTASEGTTTGTVSALTRATINYSIHDNVAVINNNTSILKTITIRPAYLFQYGGNNYIAKAKLYRFTMHRESVKSLDMVPCVRKSDNIAGMYDLVNNEFYPSNGSTDFLSPSVSPFYVNDSSGYNNTISAIKTSPSSTSNMGTSAINFPGSAGYLRLAHEVLNGVFSVSVWFKTSSSGTQCLFCDRGSTGGGPALFLLSGNSIRFDTVNTSCSTTFSYGDDKWHHIVGIYDGTYRRIYVDGVQKVAYATTSIGSLGGVLSIGGSYASSSSTTPNGNWMNGLISDWRLYSTALSPADVSNLYNTRESIDKQGNLYCNSYDEFGNSIKFSKSGIVYGSEVIEGINKVSLQDAYTLVDYIESTASQYISTGYSNITANTEIKIDFMFLSASQSAWIPLYGIRGSSNSTYFNLFINATSRYLSPNYAGFDPGTSSGTIINSYTRYTVQTDGGKFYLNGTYIPGCSTNNVLTASNTMFYLFALGTTSGVNSRGLKARIYSCKIYEGDTLVRDFIPVKRNRDGVMGLLDLVENKFHPDANTSSTSDFGYGAEVKKLHSIYTNTLTED